MTSPVASVSNITNVPGALNISLKRADDFSTTLDFTVSMEGATAFTEIVSLSTGATAAMFTTTVLDAAEGQVALSLTPAQTASLPVGTYGWRHYWAYEGNSRKTMLTGFVEVVQ